MFEVLEVFAYCVFSLTIGRAKLSNFTTGSCSYIHNFTFLTLAAVAKVLAAAAKSGLTLVRRFWLMAAVVFMLAAAAKSGVLPV